MTEKDVFAHACALFDDGEFFAAHEEWESIWMGRRRDADGPFLQGLIQAAAAYHLIERQRAKPAGRLLRAAAEKLSSYDAKRADIDVEALRARLARDLELVATGRFAAALVPRPRLLAPAVAAP